MITLSDAVSIFGNRKKALSENKEWYGDGDEERGAYIGTETSFRYITSDLDINHDELELLALKVSRSALSALQDAAQKGLNPAEVLPEIIASMWIDGIATALLLAELRRQEEAKEEAEAT